MKIVPYIAHHIRANLTAVRYLFFIRNHRKYLSKSHHLESLWFLFETILNKVNI
jgi:hypothetical protein